MLLEVEVGQTYWSQGGYRCKVLHTGRHGQDCSISMVVYTNLVGTFDSPPGIIWVLEESIFLKSFNDHPPKRK